MAHDSFSQPYAEGIVKDVRGALAQYDEGAIIASEFLFRAVTLYYNWEKEVIAEHDKVMAIQPSWLIEDGKLALEVVQLSLSF
jgi:hypothetical protein